MNFSTISGQKVLIAAPLQGLGLPREHNAVDRTNFSNRELVRRVAKFGFHSHLFINLQLFQVVESRPTNDANLKSVAFLEDRRAKVKCFFINLEKTYIVY